MFALLLAGFGLVACAGSPPESPAATASHAETAAVSSPTTGTTPGPDTDPQSGRVTPELVGVDPCALLTGREVGTVTGVVVPNGTEGQELRTDQRVCAWPGLTLIVAARTETASATLESRLTLDSVEDLLGMPAPALLALSTSDADSDVRDAIGVSLALGGGYQLALLPESPIQIGTDQWEAFLDLARLAAPRVPL